MLRKVKKFAKYHIYVAELGFEPASVIAHSLCESLETSLEEVK